MPYISQAELDRAAEAARAGRRMEVLTVLSDVAQHRASDELIREAEQLYGSSEIEIDSEASVSIADTGIWVMAWVWVETPDTGEDEDNDEEACSQCKKES